MFSLEALRIDLKALSDNLLEQKITLSDDYFAALEDAEIQSGKVDVCLTLRKTGSNYFLNINAEGFVIVTCDLCLDDMEQSIEADAQFIVKLGDGNSEDEEVIVVDENEGMLDLAWLIYETIALAVPIKHVHAPGKCNAAMTEKLEELSATRSGDETEGNIDPRWSKLAQLKDSAE